MSCWLGYLTRWTVTEETPVLLGLKLGGRVGLPHVVEGCEENDSLRAGREGGLDGAEGGGLVRLRRNSDAIRLSLPWPSCLGDDNLLALV